MFCVQLSKRLRPWLRTLRPESLKRSRSTSRESVSSSSRPRETRIMRRKCASSSTKLLNGKIFLFYSFESQGQDPFSPKCCFITEISSGCSLYYFVFKNMCQCAGSVEGRCSSRSSFQELTHTHSPLFPNHPTSRCLSLSELAAVLYR